MSRAEPGAARGFENGFRTLTDPRGAVAAAGVDPVSLFRFIVVEGALDRWSDGLSILSHRRIHAWMLRVDGRCR